MWCGITDVSLFISFFDVRIASFHSPVGAVSDCRSRDHKLKSQLGCITCGDHSIIFMAILPISAESRRAVVSYSQKNVHWLTA